ncbi:MAG TPA: DUF6600 domain-containing protein [Pyrinomonadaceae bacterium]|nr:DUF6600 domain-containing protein [Pyrinomonadaceae bacterium]
MNKIKVWPHLTLIALAFALVGGIVAAVWVRNEEPARAAVLPHAARVERIDGNVGLNHGDDEQWVEVTPNTPVSVGDRLYTRDNSQAAIAFTGRNFARLEPDSSLDVLDLSDGRTQLALRDGSAIFNVGELESDDLFEVATPVGAFDLQEPGLYEVGLNDDGSAWVSVLSGLAEVVGLAGSGQINKGEMLTLLGQTAADIALSRLSPDYAGGLLDDYYAYQYPDTYDGRYRDYDAYLNDPYYYDPSNRYVSYRYVTDTIPGVRELDAYGDWREVDGYGHLWHPRVDEGWTPYQDGYWTMDDPYGLTWVSNEPWGYAPYHYGRWANVGGQWYWVPEGVNAQPVYAPALVAFVPLTEANQIGWVPLAPGDPYVPTYYDANWQPLERPRTQFAEQLVNLQVPGAVTVIPAEYFGRAIDRKALAKGRPDRFDGARPVFDPLSVAMLRQAALQTTNTRRRVDMPPGLAKRLEGTQVFTSARPFAPPFRDGQAKALRAEAVPEKQKKQKLQFRDERQAARANVPAVAAPERGRRIESLAAEAARGNKDAARQAQELRRQERTQQRAARRQVAAPPQGGAPQAVNERAVRAVEQRPRGERVGAGREAQRAAPPRQSPVERQQARPTREARTPPGHMRQQQHAAPAQPKAERRQGPPQAGKAHPQAQRPAGKGNKGRGKP